MPKGYLAKKTNLVFYQILALGAGVLSLVIFLSFNLYPRLVLIWQSLLHKLEVICGCTNHLSFTNHPIIFSTLILSGLVLTAFFCLVIVKTTRSISLTRKFIKTNLKNRKENLSPKLKRAGWFLGLEQRLIELDVNNSVVFCFGFLRPKICMASKLVKRLNKQELQAVLLHEQHHLSTYEPLKVFLVKLMTKVLFFVPGLKLLVKQYLILSELTADEKAINNFKDKKPLVRALYKTIKLEEQIAIENGLALSFFRTVTEERVNKLADLKYIPRFRSLKPHLVASFLGLFLILSSFNLLTHNSRLDIASHGINSCPVDQIKIDHQCQMLFHEPTCNVSYELSNSSCKQA